ncbi:YgjV family protein [Uliginosibacterium aquaticum]|uniref:YgjV family protein n=1 Tax=Uliginosibacterium aquaticum TaxID=2731212 RepID=A0ABX2IHZ1_9RHOO|nr:YgjV family protein [Uliginosibacterium aquaticum]NSL56418.1 YgjV family protein [Uliginosibacterium aquaticum]
MPADVFSLPQLFGYATFVLGMVSFSRKQDHQFRKWLTLQNFVYAVHFILMGNVAATAGMLLSIARNLLSMRTRSLWVAGVLLAANFVLAFFVVKSAWNVFPLLAAAVATISMFRFSGLQLRYGMLGATLLWLVNNILMGSIGGTAMELMITAISCSTIWRLRREQPPA